MLLPTGVDAQFISLDRVDGVSRAGVEVGYVDVDGLDATPLRLSLYGQGVSAIGMGAFAAIDVSYVSGDGDSETALGNLEAGALYASHFGSFDGIARASLVLPTSSDEFSNVLTNVFNSYSRLNDLTHAFPDVTWLRLSFSPVVRRGNIVFRGDAGVDVSIHADDNANVEPILRANLAVGVVQGQSQFSAELVSLVPTENEDDDEDGPDETLNLHTLGFTYRGTFGNFSPYAGLFLFLGDADEIGSFSVTAGLSTTLGG